ncbi:hypothetical protein BH10BAC4_BH10BAC4_07700 [soil metagenome]
MKPRMVPLVMGSANLLISCFSWVSSKIKKPKNSIDETKSPS